MISYCYDQKNVQDRVRSLTKTILSKKCIFGLICLIFGGYLFPLGILYQDKDAIINGGLFLLVSISVLIYSVVTFYSFKKNIYSTFREYQKNGLIHYSVFSEEGRYTIKCIESKKEFMFAKNDIKRITRKNNLIVVELKSKHILDFPERQDIYELITN